MNARDLLGAEVRDPDGRCGYVLDLRAQADDSGALVVTEIVVGRNRMRLLGYDRSDERRPVVLRWILGVVHRSARCVPDDEITVGDAGVRLHRPWRDYPGLHEIPKPSR
ncbi:hypothetical protein [Nocardia asteroides]|uniref:hypothetical protein n=1 Tax=Nocardia asteroides TaxID=1824 RepID=UPI001E332061|nr:hypothetical protein [Nocardia asteroides]UGT63830.1 hypothetical protein LTT61_11215 [Nocardia asteroides]